MSIKTAAVYYNYNWAFFDIFQKKYPLEISYRMN